MRLAAGPHSRNKGGLLLREGRGRGKGEGEGEGIGKGREGGYF